MPSTLILSLSALVSLLPALAMPFARQPARDGVFWILLAPAVLGPLLWVIVSMGGRWHTDLSGALWVTIAASMALFALISATTSVGWRLVPLLLPYLLCLGVLATVLQEPATPGLSGRAPDVWTQAHIAMAVFAYGFLTLSAVAALAVFLQERALKRKRPTRLTRLLPSVAEGERLQITLLTSSAIVLGLGLATGMAVTFFEKGSLLTLDHKTILSLLTFGLLVILLLAHHRTGLRGRVTTRLVLCAFLLLSLAYPGVKFVTGILIG
ncbi:MAG: cytochrome c biogenesis protein CcsA [Alphaproteobacteria bacterium]|nr:cytochrome c biogenesis protein CcsA [Alphaproteobacteria bacterium]MBU0797045.1 cytochrome c biogenesis protein CcsA [Alphaproteobacteria bacterium]MBU0887853.1 cytochrome c biogenesis protein CcsA [Alphaproteobacteria bacterium]MBU1814924.1 cytochrome c biogenesis protein CcsA [Alphaproteobacteria bacterium]MBU2091987.1 cytochrome c biogenesis protein CcsA [Alphaproteobacteria bacterium]